MKTELELFSEPKTQKRLANGRFASKYQKYWDNKIIEAKVIFLKNKSLEKQLTVARYVIDIQDLKIKRLKEALENQKQMC